MAKMIKEVDISNMEESKDYCTCPYCKEPEPDIPGYKEALTELEKYKNTDKYWAMHQQLFKDIPIDNYYTVNGKTYPFDANLLHFSDAYAKCHYGVTVWWNQIHCCPKCKREYYTVHEH